MTNSFQLDIVTPTSVINEGLVDYVRAPALDGLFGIEAGHAPAIIGLGIGEIKVNKGSDIIFYSTSGGYADIRSEGVMLLLESVEEASEIDQKRADEAVKRAKSRLGNDRLDKIRARAALERAKNRLKISHHND
ncbi:MAG: ATP synthase F1 subunit epsilon [Candidatus Marinimicrobia bacterium]|jgi:F-type H+-transporting ATPase subunit epsilon|nr:ATP synthase F1 subunit epsilon [Candidatus Neomarinimicrobiota bacterium]MBT3632751.1 ATP synthase F1 subunit epsilon [Candidatus Neomarinimicrobiota bacterium]MBT3681861.1 ATP synthase F1 subunit epsilon [Candidatus Neomarinimicrobiota bacterium]MBT3760506.1 ATP synthase F1 subunit epsilon [Candidatus Neomarinimicrobiota bacterium]MBT3896652.1 ATP synthase F1 subunit epsilon [Candidatus Neomarinimicrobiota bacterium]